MRHHNHLILPVVKEESMRKDNAAPECHTPDPHAHAAEVTDLIEKLRDLATYTRKEEDAQYVRNIADLIEQVMVRH